MLVVCPGCNTNYSLDERTFTGTTRLICRECGTETTVAMTGTQEASRAAQSHAAPPAPAAAPNAAAPAARAADRAPGAAPIGPTTCPACGHRFAPGEQTATPARPRAAGKTPGRLLLVEDQGYFIQLTRDALGPEFEVTAVGDVAGAEQALGKERFDLVILDLSLQGNQDGRSLLRSIRKHSIPALIFTARDESEFYGSVWEDLKAAGATDILLKGVNVGEELKRKVVELIGKTDAT